MQIDYDRFALVEINTSTSFFLFWMIWWLCVFFFFCSHCHKRMVKVCILNLNAMRCSEGICSQIGFVISIKSVDFFFGLDYVKDTQNENEIRLDNSGTKSTGQFVWFCKSWLKLDVNSTVSNKNRSFDFMRKDKNDSFAIQIFK